MRIHSPLRKITGTVGIVALASTISCSSSKYQPTEASLPQPNERSSSNEDVFSESSHDLSREIEYETICSYVEDPNDSRGNAWIIGSRPKREKKD